MGDYTNSRLGTLREILAMLQDSEHGGRTEAYEATVNYIQEELRGTEVQDAGRCRRSG